MSRRKSQKHSDISSSDVRLNDFANSKVVSGCSRLKKNALTFVTDEIKTLNKADDDRAWDEKLSDLVPDAWDDDEPNDEKTVRRSKKKSGNSESNDDSGVDYPVDLWYLLSHHVAPEDVGRFAGICKASYSVTCSAGFWFSLYKRCYRYVDGVPEELKPSYVVRRYGLRTSVIRSLFFTYTPFINRVNSNLDSNGNLEKLFGRVCVSSWNQSVKGRNQWIYSFKLKEVVFQKNEDRRAREKPNFLEILDDINANIDDRCIILQIRSHSFVPIPMLNGLRVVDCVVKMATDLKSHIVVLHFNRGLSKYDATIVVVHGVLQTRTLNWWHPSFSRQELHGGMISPYLIKNLDFS